MKAFSRDFLEREKTMLDRVNVKALRIGFCGNIANCMYVRAVPLRKAGLDVSIFIHPHDTYVMSHPGWEEYDGTAPESGLSVDALKAAGIELPHVAKVFSPPSVAASWSEAHRWAILRYLGARLNDRRLQFMRPGDLVHFPSYGIYKETLIALQQMDVLWGTQVAYLAYLANRPYVVSQAGGDLWFDASRGDELGQLSRTTFATARLNLVSNPWVFAHARRYGLNNLIYLPKVIDQHVYAPGPSPSRARWEQETGGSFFVLTSSRLDERNKGSSVGIEGFARFSRRHPEARLVLFGWGNDREKLQRNLGDLGIADRVLALPVSGKARLRQDLCAADVFMDQFVLGYFGSAGMEAMACGVPVIGRYELEQYEALCETGAPPVLNAETAEAVEQHLERMFSDAEARRACAAATRQWFVDNHGSERWLPEHQAVLAATAHHRPARMRHSPLREPLSAEEIAYHAEGLRNAPVFPNYGY